VKRIVLLSVLVMTVVAAFWASGCASEPAQTQALYTDAKKMSDEIERAFTLPGSNERRDLMNKFIREKWDLQIVDKLRQYLREAPKGKYAAEATALLDMSIKSQHLQALGQVRPILEQQNQGTFTAPNSADSTAKSTPGGN